MTNLSCTKFERHFGLLIDEQLDGESRRELLDHIAVCSACGEQYAWIETASAQLLEIGQRITVGVPEIDVVEDVLAQVRALKLNSALPSHGAEIIAFDRVATKRSAKNPSPIRWLAAAAAVILMAGGAWLMYQTLGPSDSTKVVYDTTEERETPEPSPLESTVPAVTPNDSTETVLEVTPAVTPEPEILETPPPPAARPQKQVAREDVLASFRDAVAIDDRERSERGASALNALARLTEEEAHALLRFGAEKDQGFSSAAIAGIAQSLSPSERRQALLTAVGTSPDDPYLRFQLAREYQSDPEKQADAMSELARVEELDSANAVVPYSEAQLLLAQDPPDVNGAIEALARANDLDFASSYASEAAIAREQALLETGVDPVTAELVSALSAGYWEFNELTTLAGDLMASADSLAESGDVNSATQIYEAVRQMGDDLNSNAQFAQERLAGAQIEDSASSALALILEAQGQPSEAERIREGAGELLVTMNELTEHFQRAENFLGIPVNDDTALSQLAQLIFAFGDLSAFAAGVALP